MPPRKIAHKRQASSTQNATIAAKKSRKSSDVVSSATPKRKIAAKSKAESESEDASSEDDYVSAYEDQQSGEESSEAEEESDFDENPTSRRASGAKAKAKGKGNTTPSANLVGKAKDLLKPGVKTGMAPGTQVVIKKPKARPAGKTPYRDDTVHPNTFQFLQDLAANNNREWLKSKFSFVTPCIEHAVRLPIA